jgi:hypothetical protein
MWAIALVSTLVGAPIPKTPHEGRIAVVVAQPSQMLLILNPSGQVEKKIDLNDIPDRVYSVKLSRDARSALIICTSEHTFRIGNQLTNTKSGYLIDLTGENKPKRLIEKQFSPSWVINRGGNKAYGSNIDVEKYLKRGQSLAFDCQNWCIDIKTGVSEPIGLPANHFIIDLSADDETFLTSTVIEERNCAALVSLKTWKPMVLTDVNFELYGIAPNGKRILARDNGSDGEMMDPLRREKGIIVFDLNSKSKRMIDRPEGSSTRFAFSYGADGKRICFIAYFSRRGIRPPSDRYQLYTCNIDGTNPKMIYEAKDGEMLSDCDWR